MGLRRERVAHSDIEGDILTAMVTSTDFLNHTAGMYRKEYFTDYARLVADWVVDYYTQYHQAPGRNIQSIYKVNKEQIKPALATNIETYLTNLNSKYEDLQEFNLPYMVDQAQGYYRKRGYALLFEHGQELMRAGYVEDAQQLLNKFTDVALSTSKWENPFDPNVISRHYHDKEENTNVVLHLRGALGQLAGPLERTWLVAFTGPMKRGKSFWQQEACFNGISQKKRVAYINLEMNPYGVRDREYRRLTGLPDEPGINIIPLFDCACNQLGACPVPQKRTNTIPLYELPPGVALQDVEEDLKPKYEPGDDYGGYQVCTACRGDNTGNFITDVWYTHTEHGEVPTSALIRQRAGQFIRQYGDRFRQLTYPAYSASLTDVNRDLDDLAYTEGFVPDMVVIDYADILAPSEQGLKGREVIDNIWKGMKRMAAERQALIVTGDQTTRQAINRQSIEQVDTSEDIRKLAHVDAKFSLNQTPTEKEYLCMRVGTLAHRHKKFTRGEVIVLQQLGIGQIYLDSEWRNQTVFGFKGKKRTEHKTINRY